MGCDRWKGGDPRDLDTRRGYRTEEVVSCASLKGEGNGTEIQLTCEWIP